MTESEYLRATNNIKISTALNIVKDVIPGEEYGISKEILTEIKELLLKANSRLFDSYILE